MDNRHLCELCQRAYEAEEVVPGGIRKLKEFRGYTVDLRLRQFRKISLDKLLEFIEFSSPKGQQLLAQMHTEAVQQARKNLADLEKRLHISFEKLLKRQKQEEVTR